MTDTKGTQLAAGQQSRSAVAVSQTTHEDFQQMADEIDLVELFYRLLNGWKLLVSFALIGVLTAGLYTTYAVKPTYTAQSTIYVVSRDDSVINMSDLQLGSALTSDYVKVFNMWELHETVISMLDLPYSYREIREHLSVKNETNTRMLDIAFTSESPEEAAAVVNAYASVVCSYIEDKMMTSRPSIMSTARVPTTPVGPNRTRNIMIGFIAGFALAAAVITLRMLTDDKFKSEGDILKYTGLPVLASIPNDPDRDDRNKKQVKKKHGRKTV